MARELSTALAWLQRGEDVVLAVVARTWGSAPRRAGSLMVVRADGVFEGSVSGGCVEGAVIAEAATLLENHDLPKTKTLTFAVSSNQAWEVGLACGGEIAIRLFRLETADTSKLEMAQKHAAERRAFSLVFSADGALEVAALTERPSKAIPSDADGVFTVPILPMLQLDIVGAVHISQHLAAMAQECEFQVRIVDPRGAFSEERAFAGVSVSPDWPDDFFADNPPDETTAVVTLTHDPKLDDAALGVALRSKAFYIGSLGSKKTHAARVSRLTKAGISEAEIGTLHAPIGLDIGAATPAEIAAAILAEIIQVARKKS